MAENTGWISDMELAQRGIGYDSQRQARNSGALRHTVTGSGFTYSAADVAAWLESQAGQIRGRTFVKSAPQPARAANQPSQVYGSSGGAKQQWQAAVDRHVDGGMSRAAAVRAVDAERPGLREQMLAEHNRR